MRTDIKKSEFLGKLSANPPKHISLAVVHAIVDQVGPMLGVAFEKYGKYAEASATGLRTVARTIPALHRHGLLRKQPRRDHRCGRHRVRNRARGRACSAASRGVSEVEAVDFPQANRLTIHIMATIAEHEAKLISDRTRSALAAAKARGKRLGGFRGRPGTAADCAKARRARSASADARAADLAPVIEDIRTAGAKSLGEIARELDAREISAARGGQWSAAQVRMLFKRLRHQPLGQPRGRLSHTNRIDPINRV
jgi:resolvase-like protein